MNIDEKIQEMLQEKTDRDNRIAKKRKPIIDRLKSEGGDDTGSESSILRAVKIYEILEYLGGSASTLEIGLNEARIENHMNLNSSEDDRLWGIVILPQLFTADHKLRVRSRKAIAALKRAGLIRSIGNTTSTVYQIIED